MFSGSQISCFIEVGDFDRGRHFTPGKNEEFRIKTLLSHVDKTIRTTFPEGSVFLIVKGLKKYKQNTDSKLNKNTRLSAIPFKYSGLLGTLRPLHNIITVLHRS